MRSPGEIAFRLRQEAANFELFRWPPDLTASIPLSLPLLPNPDLVAAALKGSGYEAETVRLAEDMLANKLPLLGFDAVYLGQNIAWRRDPQSGIESALAYFRRVPYLDARQVGNQKLVWEFNRHAHLVVLAQAWRLTGDTRYTRHIFAHLESWWRENPFQQGMNWTAALEVALRALSWVWVYHLAGGEMAPEFRRQFLTELYRHGRHLAVNLSVYSSPNTHLLGEAVALHALGRLFPQFPRAAEWRREGAAVVQQHIQTHVRSDGMYFEQTTYYHVYALDMFLFHALLEETSEAFQAGLKRMARIAASIAGPMRRLPFLGDDDGGRLFYPYGERAKFVRGSLAVSQRMLGIELGAGPEDDAEIAAWWLGPSSATPKPALLQSQYWPVSGLVSMISGVTHVLVDAGPFGAGTAGHSHADTLSLVVREGERDLLLDPGTYCYLSEPEQREWFRSTAAHNTVSVDGLNQAEPVNTFRWADVPRVRVEAWESNDAFDNLQAECEYRGLRHKRQVVFCKESRLVCVLDEVEGAGEHEVVQHWHTPDGLPEERAIRIGRALLLSAAAEVNFSESAYSLALGVKRTGRQMRVSQRGALPAVLGAVLDLDGRYSSVELVRQKNGWCFALPGVQVKMGIKVDLYTSSRVGD